MRYAILGGFFVVVIFGLPYLPLPLWGQLVLIWVIAFGVLGPLLVRLGTAAPVAPDVHPFDPAVHDATFEQLTHLSTTAAQLAPLGFAPLGELFIDRPANRLGTKVRIMLLVLENDAGTRAVATAHALVAGERTVQRAWVELATRFPSHVRVTSSFPRRWGPAQDQTRRRIEWFPQLRHAALLARVHEALLARDDAGEPTPKPLDSLAGVLAVYMREEYEQLAADGFYQLDGSGTNWVPTLRGAFELALRNHWPFASIWNALARRRASALLTELGLAGLESGLAP